MGICDGSSGGTNVATAGNHSMMSGCIVDLDSDTPLESNTLTKVSLDLSQGVNLRRMLRVWLRLRLLLRRLLVLRGVLRLGRLDD